MTPRSVQVGLIRFVRVDADGRVTGRCVAMDVSRARLALPCRDGETVSSAASHAVGWPKTLRLGPVHHCGNCHKAIAPGAGPYCDGCTTVKARVKADRASRRAARLAAKARHEAKPDRRAAKTAWQRQAREAQRQANIARGIERRAAQRALARSPE